MKANLFANKKILVIIVAALIVGGIATGVVLSFKNSAGKVPEKNYTGAFETDNIITDEEHNLVSNMVTDVSDNVLLNVYGAGSSEGAGGIAYSDARHFHKWASSANIIEFEKKYPNKLTIVTEPSQVLVDSEYALDVSDALDGSVVAYLTSDSIDGETKTILHIAGKNDVVMANAESKKLFYGLNVTEINFNGCFNTVNAVCMDEMFSCCSNLTELDLRGFNTANVTSMEGMFDKCRGLKVLDVSSFNTANVTTFVTMFYHCESLMLLDLSNFNTSKVTDMRAMFADCVNLTELNLSNFDTTNVVDMDLMFRGCEALLKIDLSSFKTPNLKTMSGIFEDCMSATLIDVSGFDTTNVESMIDAFKGCASIEKLNLSHFSTDNVNFMRKMFSGCSNLCELDISGFNINGEAVYDGATSFYENSISVLDGVSEKIIIKYQGKEYGYEQISDLYDVWCG